MVEEKLHCRSSNSERGEYVIIIVKRRYVQPCEAEKYGMISYCARSASVKLDHFRPKQQTTVKCENTLPRDPKACIIIDRSHDDRPRPAVLAAATVGGGGCGDGNDDDDDDDDAGGGDGNGNGGGGDAAHSPQLD
ncbi:hypothetical protein T11_3466 [Trichinella zimbabwensis]|uniref:Uncharacterized protein n=1 Tax=Trichinella zimbabwensis TaxID=268475 RepID=A0A0V1H346_9BILA|nr:hypothetical protein T11_3466 [Trichinella zimbabwensis]